MSARCREVKVGWVHVMQDGDDRGSSGDRPISLSLEDRAGERGFTRYDTWLYREEALELGRALIAAASTHVSGKE